MSADNGIYILPLVNCFLIAERSAIENIYDCPDTPEGYNLATLRKYFNPRVSKLF